MTISEFQEIKEALKEAIRGTDYENRTYIVGGAVRDMVMGVEIKDIDMVVNIPNGGLKLAKYLFNAGYLVHEPIEYPQYSVSMFVLKEFPDVEIEAVQTRSEKYTDSNSRNPETAFGSIEEDCIRRDLTINSLYMNVVTDEILDLTGRGIDDINNHIIRVTNNDPDIVFVDDPLRILRIVRFASRYGWKIDGPTYEAMKRNVDRLSIISIERINDEFSKIIICNHPKMALNLLRDIDAIKYIIPELESLYDCTQNEWHGFDTVWEHTMDFIQVIESNDLVLRLSALLHDIGKPATRTVKDGKIHFYSHEMKGAEIAKDVLLRLRYPNDVIKEVTFYIRNHMSFYSFTSDNPNPKVIRRVQYECRTVDRFKNLLKLMQADSLSVPDKYKDPDLYKNIMCYSDKMVENETSMFSYELPVNGDDIMRIKLIQPGPQVKKIKDMLIEHAIKHDPKMDYKKVVNLIRNFKL